MPKSDFVDIWEVFDLFGSCLGWVDNRPYYAWCASLKKLVPEMRQTDWSLRQVGAALCPFGTSDARKYNIVVPPYAGEEASTEMLAYVVAIRAIAL